jgi:hypothetical protein
MDRATASMRITLQYKVYTEAAQKQGRRDASVAVAEFAIEVSTIGRFRGGRKPR